MRAYTAEDIKRISTDQGISMHEAKNKLDKINMLEQVASAKTVYDIKQVLYKLIEGL